MKKLILGFAAVCLLSLASFAQTSDEGLIGRARGAASECLQNAPTSWEIIASVETLGICFVSGELKRVTFVASYRCHTEICPKLPDLLVGYVDFDCDGNIIGVSCY